jgi:hypothetical protein
LTVVRPLARLLFGGPVAVISRPRELLEDLSIRLGVPGSSESRSASLWSMAWMAARGIDYVTIVAPLLLVIAFLIILVPLALLGIRLAPAPAGQVRLFSELLALFFLTAQAVADGIALFLLAKITVDLSRRQRIREEWVLRGLSTANARAAAQVTAAEDPAPAAEQPGFTPRPQPQPGLAPSQPGPVPQPGVLPYRPVESTTVSPPPDLEQPVIQPSSRAVPRYRAPRGIERSGPVDSRSDDLHLGEGI